MDADIGKLRWRCRRGMKELDLLLTRYVDERYREATPDEQQAFRQLLDADERDKVRQMLSLEELYMVTRRAHLAEPRGDRWQLMFDDANL